LVGYVDTGAADTYALLDIGNTGTFTANI
jgi:hypothetical protein